jgi:hypothetical protein
MTFSVREYVGSRQIDSARVARDLKITNALMAL